VQSLAALKQIRSKDGLVFPWPWCQSYLWKAFGDFLKRAGLPHDGKSKFHRIRKTVASYAEAAGGNATAMLQVGGAHWARRFAALPNEVIRPVHVSVIVKVAGQPGAVVYQSQRCPGKVDVDADFVGVEVFERRSAISGPRVGRFVV
jgi:hypothetical protein